MRKKHRPSYFGFRIFWFSFSIRIPQSAFRNLEAGEDRINDGKKWVPNGSLPGENPKLFE
jgi:hypothetical protein